MRVEMLQILAAAGMIGGTISNRGNDGSKGALPTNPNKVIPKGCKEYIIHGTPIIALSEKRAWAKYSKLKK